MNINKIGYHHNHDSSLFIERPNGSGDYLLLLVFTPSCMMLNGKQLITTEPFFILYNKGTPQRYGAADSDYMDDWLHFSMSGQEAALLSELGIPMDTPITLEDMSELSDMIQAMTYEFHSPHTLREENLKLYLRLFFNKLSENFNMTQNSSPHFPVFNKIRSHIYNEPYLEHSIDDLAANAGLSRSSFQHIYRQLFGVSTVSDIIRARTEYACYLLSSTRLPVYQIADLCGYHSEIHFMRQFKEQTGKTPSGYRKADNSV